MFIWQFSSNPIIDHTTNRESDFLKHVPHDRHLNLVPSSVTPDVCQKCVVSCKPDSIVPTLSVSHTYGGLHAVRTIQTVRRRKEEGERKKSYLRGHAFWKWIFSGAIVFSDKLRILIVCKWVKGLLCFFSSAVATSKFQQYCCVSTSSLVKWSWQSCRSAADSHLLVASRWLQMKVRVLLLISSHPISSHLIRSDPILFRAGPNHINDNPHTYCTVMYAM